VINCLLALASPSSALNAKSPAYQLVGRFLSTVIQNP
jgi:hypothetical protein